MKKQVQLTGIRDWFGDHWLLIQNELWSWLENWLTQYSTACIVSGCKISSNASTPANYDITSGIIFIQDTNNNWQYARFAGATNVSLPQYFVCAETDTNALYKDGNSKQIIISMDASLQTSLPSSGGYLQLLATGTKTWRDVIQDSNYRFVTDAQIAAWDAATSIKPGFVMMQAMSVVPDGWFECDGHAISRTTYASLFAAIGTTYGTGDGSTTFNLPDMRGYFPRGWDHGAGVDSGRVLGSEQTDDMKAHYHLNGVVDDKPEGDSQNIFVYGQESTDLPGLAKGNVSDGGGGVNYQGKTSTVGTSQETRPKNIAFVFIIKY